jgi:hypothetical protein
MWNFIRELFFLDLIGDFLKRVLRIVVLFILLLAVFLLWRGESISGILRRFRGYATAAVAQVTGREAPAVPGVDQPPDFHEVIPAEWTIQYMQRLNIDHDSEEEWLLIYRYDKAARGFGGPLGAVIYDPQPDRSPANLATPTAYRPSSYIPYHLEPRHGGKGYVGERAGSGAVSWSRIVQVYDVQGDGRDELVLQGYSGYTDFPTSLAIFEWVDKAQGYRLMTSSFEEVLWGDGGIEVDRQTITQPDGTTTYGPIEQVILRRRLYEPFYYARSQLCRRIVYTWDGIKAALEPADYSLDFCFGRPRDPDDPEGDPYPPGLNSYRVWYPEEALLANYPDGQVSDISLPASGEVGSIVDAVAVVKIGGGKTMKASWRLMRQTSGKVREMTWWDLLPLSIDP